MHYRALYRKYRPTDFSEIVGQNHIIKTLINTIKNNRVGHAYLFCGSRGTGKTSVAKIFARTVNCENLKDGVQCNKCIICNSKNTDDITDIIEIDAASNNGVDEIREIKNKATLAPVLCKYKVYIIDEVHMLSTGAFNALLKTLEEPPQHVIFILATTEPQKIPITIISRCQRFDFKKILVDDIQNKLKEISVAEKIKIDDYCIREISKLAEGSLRDAIGLLDQVCSFTNGNVDVDKLYDLVGMMQISKIINIVENIFSNDIDKLMDFYEEMVENSKDFEKTSEKILEILVNLMIYKNASKYFSSKDLFYKDEIIKLDKLINRERLGIVIEEMNELLEKIKKSSNPNILFEMFLLKNISFQPNLENIEQENTVIVDPIVKDKNKIKEKTKNIIISNTLKNSRINNTLALASNEKKKEIKKIFMDLKTHLIDGENKSIISLLMDSEVVAASENHILLKYKYESLVQENDNNINKIEKIISELTNVKYKVVAICCEEWETIRPHYIEMKNKNGKIELIEENEDDTISCSKDEECLYGDIINDFGDGIIEMEGKI